jgi:hypothetical protein
MLAHNDVAPFYSFYNANQVLKPVHPAASTPYNFDGTRCEYLPYGYKLHPEVCPAGQRAAVQICS